MGARKHDGSKKQDGNDPGSKKIHFEIVKGNWKRLDAYLDSYNSDPERITPRIGIDDVVNAALYSYLRAKTGATK